MRFFRVSAWGNKMKAVVGFLIFAASAQTTELSSFTVEPSTVTAGRTLTVLYQSDTPLRDGRARVGESESLFYKEGPTHWRARLGIDAREKAGTHTLLVTGKKGWKRFRAEIPFIVRKGTYPVSRIRLNPEKDSLYTSGTVAADANRLASFYVEPGSSQKQWDGAFLKPTTGVVSSVFGAQRSYGARPPSGSHSGVDLANAAGTRVEAPARGRVVLAEWMDGFGNVVLLDHGQGVYTYYLHMQSINIKVGQWAHPGRLLGLMGQEGVATGPHLHWSLVVSGVRVDPMEWVERAIP
jgi:murein DD-endopeptidase MepM/ murein hydrolase activator NlpD